MNCEKCKSKKATLFYADEGGIKHALCASCGDSINKLSALCQSNGAPTTKFIPEKKLYSFYTQKSAVAPNIRKEVGEDAVCSSCKTALSEIIERGEFICPQCFESFEDYLLPRYILRDGFEGGARMPSSRRSDIDRKKELESLRHDIKLAVEHENYELAASLRDKAKKLEAMV